MFAIAGRCIAAKVKKIIWKGNLKFKFGLDGWRNVMGYAGR